MTRRFALSRMTGIVLLDTALRDDAAPVAQSLQSHTPAGTCGAQDEAALPLATHAKDTATRQRIAAGARNAAQDCPADTHDHTGIARPPPTDCAENSGASHLSGTPRIAAPTSPRRTRSYQNAPHPDRRKHRPEPRQQPRPGSPGKLRDPCQCRSVPLTDRPHLHSSSRKYPRGSGGGSPRLVPPASRKVTDV